MAFDFPAAPALNEVFGNYTYNGMGWAITPGATGPAGDFVSKTGDVMSGDLSIKKAMPGLFVSRTDPAQPAHLVGMLNDTPQWSIIMGNPGSDFNINRIMDDGSNPEPVTGVLNINRVSGDIVAAGNFSIKNASPMLSLNKTSSMSNATIRSAMNNLARWFITPGDTTSESGSNIGSDFVIVRCDDNGNTIDAPFQIRRNSGYAFFLNNVSIGSFDRYAALTIGKGPGFTGDILFQNNSSTRWALQCDSAPDTGEAGSNFSIGRYNTAGVYVGPVLQFARDTAFATFYNQVQLVDFNNRWELNGGFVISSDNAFKPTGGSWIALSDARIKNVVGNYQHGLAEIMQLNPVTYQFKGNASTRAPAEGEEFVSSFKDVMGREFIGLVAQEAEVSMPEMVKRIDGYIDGAPVTDLRTLDVSALTYALINAVKELSAKVTALEAQLAAR